MIYLSDEQMSVALFGIPKGASPSWELIELPTGPRSIPEWARDLRVDFAEAYGNSPRYAIKTRTELRDWQGKRFKRDGDRFLAVSEDGRAECFYQGGPLTMTTLRRFRTEDGKLHQIRPDRPGASHIIRSSEDLGNLHAPGEWVEVERMCTRQEDGFGGAHIDIILDDGTEATLRGPWHGACPPGFVEVSYYNLAAPWRAQAWWRRSKARPWWDGVGTGGLFITEELFLRIFARYQAHLTLARVDLGQGWRIQAMKPEWHEPKAWIQARARYAKKKAAYEAMPQDQRPPHVNCNFPKVCAGKSHCAVAECNHCMPRAAA